MMSWLVVCLILGSLGVRAWKLSDYTDVLDKSILFYEAQRSGKLPSTNRVKWRGDSALNDGKDKGVDLTGGWYDAGDNVKFNFPMAWSVTTLAWGIIEFEDAYRKTGKLDLARDSIKWPLDYFIKCHTAEQVLYGQVGDGNADHSNWQRPEDMTSNRPSFKIDAGRPGSDLAAETAAAMAAGSMVFKSTDSKYANTLLTHARSLYQFAMEKRGKYSDSIWNAQNFYKSWSGYEDELLWGGMWMYRATGERSYLDNAMQFSYGGNPKFFSWDDKKAGAYVLLYQAGKDKSRFKRAVEDFLRQWISPDGIVKKTPKGLSWGDKWGPLRYSANSALIALMAAEQGILTKEARDFAISQIHYMMGDGGRSYIVGFGKNPPVQPHHRASSCPDIPKPCGWNDYNSQSPNPHVLNGALVGGPDEHDNYQDKRSDYVMNEVACDYNAGFQSAVAGLAKLSMQGSIPSEPSEPSQPSEPSNPGQSGISGNCEI